MRELSDRISLKLRREVPGAKLLFLNLINILTESRNYSELISLSSKKKMPSSRPSAKKSMNSKIKLKPYSNRTHNSSLKINDSPKPFIRKSLIMKSSRRSLMPKILKNPLTWMSSNTKRKSSSRKLIIWKVNWMKSKESRILKFRNLRLNSNLKSKASRDNPSRLRRFTNKSWESWEMHCKRKNTRLTSLLTDWKEYHHKVSTRFWDWKRRKRNLEQSWCTLSRIVKNRLIRFELSWSQITLIRLRR